MNGRTCVYAGYSLSEIFVHRDRLKVDVSVTVNVVPENGGNVTSQTIEWEALSRVFNPMVDGEFHAAMSEFLPFIRNKSREMADSYMDAFRSLETGLAA
ncbi:hypothetical protein [Devosia sp. Leaf64]|uniref:hypothetical protein n=1 Tax=Devosia sp. Leaf64 TaxID=1736229 RepID=UPI000715D8B7|nr:hypothetical protein [Devosia sp. Leaf64]KQN75035.1 hypothetical protein ASE94_01570 [Devosia sp. Leaf64]